MMKSDQEVRAKLKELLDIDCTRGPDETFRATLYAKVAAAKALLWVLGENDDDRWHIKAAPGPPIDIRVKAFGSLSEWIKGCSG